MGVKVIVGEVVGVPVNVGCGVAVIVAVKEGKGDGVLDMTAKIGT